MPSTTLDHLLKPEAASRRTDGPYFFCRTPACPVVYFTATGESLFLKDDLTVRVGWKETEPPIPVCYCFEFTREDIFAAVAATGRSTVSDQITARVQAGECSCETRNPQGSCCLGQVRATEKEALARITNGATAPVK